MWIVRLLFFLFALFNLVILVHMVLDDGLGDRWWDVGGPLFGPQAYPFNAAVLLAVSVGYLYAAVSESTFRPGTRLRIAVFLLLHAYVTLSMGDGNWIFVAFPAVLFFAVCHGYEDRKPRGSKNKQANPAERHPERNDDASGERP